MMAVSLGYFTPRSAANALMAHKQQEPFACEWYSHLCSCRGKGYFDKDTLLEVGENVIRAAFTDRRDHKSGNPMNSFQRAWVQVEAELAKPGRTSGELAGWF